MNKLTHKNLCRLIKLTKPYTVKRLHYVTIFLGSFRYCSQCQKHHSGECNK